MHPKLHPLAFGHSDPDLSSVINLGRQYSSKLLIPHSPNIQIKANHCPVLRDTIELEVLSIFQMIFRMNGLNMVSLPTIMTLGLSVCELFTLVKLSAQWLFRSRL